MLINYFKGNMKLVGVRPLSKHYFELYNKDLQKRRIKYKPGLIPPFYADLPSDLDAIQASENRYLDSYDRHPVRTDFRYFWKSVFNILFKHVRSG
jgi:lipopolysaccharide/colanic/teichoic acid biosynthesis glycosyltransferase